MPRDFSTLYTDPPQPQGIVKNNPGNLRIGLPWQGLKLGIPGGFCSFINMAYGIRAMALDLTTKITKDGLNTIALEVAKYAPPSENDTAKYISRVCGYTGWGPNDPIDLSVPGTLGSLVRAHINVELGDDNSALITDDDLNEGLGMIGQSVFDQPGNFFVNNPEISAAWGLGLIAVALVILGIITKRINLAMFKKIVK